VKSYIIEPVVVLVFRSTYMSYSSIQEQNDVLENSTSVLHEVSVAVDMQISKFALNNVYKGERTNIKTKRV
jgi:hypothetical protein